MKIRRTAAVAPPAHTKMARVAALLGVGLCLTSGALRVQAQGAAVARVAVLQRVGEKRLGTTRWNRAAEGEALNSGAAFRTGKRSKADIKFGDGSLLRLGQLSSVEMRGARSVALQSGQLLFVTLRPGRVLVGGAAAEIKGSVVRVRLRRDGVATISLYAGAVDVTGAGATVAVPVGYEVDVDAAGNISQPRIAPPLQFSDGYTSELLTPPSHAPFISSPRHEVELRDSSRLLLDETVQIHKLPDALFPPPQAPVRPPVGGGGPIFTFFGASPVSSASTRGVPGSGASLSSLMNFGAKMTLPNYQAGEPAEIRLAQLSTDGMPATGTTAEAAVTVNAAEAALDSSPSDLDLRAAYNHLREADESNGRSLDGDFSLVGAATDAGTLSGGGRLHGMGTLDNLLLDVAARPLRLRTSDRDMDYSAVSDASLLYRSRALEVQAGRQRFLQGPAHNTLYGSILRRRGHNVMDAVRVAPNVGEGRQIEVAYLYDAFPRNLPYRNFVDGRQSGFYGRGAVQTRVGNFGLNLLKYRDRTVGRELGASLDFAVPLFADNLEVYGELGRDTFRRRVTTLGATLPGLYDKTGFDLYVEYAKLHRRNGIPAPAAETTVRLYRDLGPDVRAVASYSHFKRTSSVLTVGLAFGMSTRRR